ncbi:MAG: HAD family hydrolase [Gemmatimonadota bacterium]|nr:HAD family hydrolase [Gemmatimonadota bacterium]
MNLPVAILIDLDDTIVSYSTYAGPCWKRACYDAAGRIDGADAEELYRTLTEAKTWFWADPERHRANRQDMPRANQRLIQIGLRRLGIEDRELAGTIAQSYERERGKTIKPFPGALETVRKLRACGVRMALVTNGGAEPQREKIRRFDLAPLFDAILIEGECGYGKPDTRIYMDALRLLDAAPGDAWMVGDNLEWEVAVPQKLGIFCVWNDAKGEGLPENSGIRPDRIIRSLPELLPSRVGALQLTTPEGN